LTPQEEPRGTWEEQKFSDYIEKHSKGTIVYFDSLKEGIRNTIDYLKYAIALYFRFSLIDSNFNIYLNNEKITIEHLDKLADKTQFLWVINDLEDPYVNRLNDGFNILEEETLEIDRDIKGFIASVEKPTHLKVLGTEEKASIDLFVNGRLRERDIIKHIPTARVPENYLYGQIHYDNLDNGKDRFATSREGIKADDPKYEMLLDTLKKQVINKIIDQWDKWRRKHRKPGDSENTSISPKERMARELFNVVSDEYSLPKKSENKGKIDQWVSELGDDAQFNFSSYAECFVSENLLRMYIKKNCIKLSKEAKLNIQEYQKREDRNKNVANLSIELRQGNSALSYLDMDGLANLVDKPDDPNKQAGIARDAKEYKPIRDALAHTALLTDLAKKKLTTVYKNIKERVRTLLSGK